MSTEAPKVAIDVATRFDARAWLNDGEMLAWLSDNLPNLSFGRAW